MTGFKLQVSKRTLKRLKKLDRSQKEEILEVFGKILVNPRSFKPLKYELKGFYRARIGKYRIIFRIDGDVVFIETIEHRDKVY